MAQKSKKIRWFQVATCSMWHLCCSLVELVLFYELVDNQIKNKVFVLLWLWMTKVAPFFVICEEIHQPEYDDGMGYGKLDVLQCRFHDGIHPMFHETNV